jgi:hypothetical protein
MNITPENRSNLILFIITLFLFLWAYTEVTEYSERENFTTEVYKFVAKGDRYTQAEGDAERKARLALEDRIRKLEESKKGEYLKEHTGKPAGAGHPIN